MEDKIKDLFQRNEAALRDLSELTDTIGSIRQVLKVSSKLLQEIYQQLQQDKENSNEVIK